MDAKNLLKGHIAKVTQLTDAEFDHCFAQFKLRQFQKGQAVVTAGDMADEEYFVVSGCLKTFFINEDMKMFILQFAMPTWWASDYHALYERTRATINVDSVTDAVVLSITNDDREKLCRDFHNLEYFFRWRTNRGYVASQKRLLSFMNNNVKFRYEEFLKLYPDVYNIVPKNLIAAYLGVSRETLSRLYNT
ncbi:Crp/Fnr family transcriptional regulator [Pseudochryseolinea flava]|uniref:Crp/Fnr family transcriptional regulator n=1 Tax=Pseudochryseolinea flava TaxID=2059302 RepID=A0A364Y0R8_9BACT|nr:Crp/Fnr family transcriptional regulator [Pseudochryseolinea flava]RAW00402.1 Crp/Fnr family transcriptional regulator [Pseudochryseolinea flava]